MWLFIVGHLIVNSLQNLPVLVLGQGPGRRAEWDTSRSPLFIKKKKMTREELRFYFPEEFLPNGSVISF